MSGKAGDISAHDAAAALAAVEDVHAATRRSVGYRLASDQLILWGGIVALADVVSYAAPRSAGRIWLIVSAIGFIASMLLSRRMARLGYGEVWRMFAGFALFFVFGLFWSLVIGHFDGRQLSAFWPTFVMFGYALAGLWLGRAFIMLGVGLSALIALGYLGMWPWFDLYLAVVNGGGLMLCGLWMKRA